MDFKDFSQKDELHEILKRSAEIPQGVLIFKHSTRCAISSMALNRLKRNWTKDEEELPVYYLDIIRNREVSNLVSEHFQVQHESPQVLLIKNGQCVYQASHNAISPDRIAEEAEHV